MQNFSQYLTCRSMLAKKQGKGFSETETKEILRQVLAQLNTLHERRQSHGSISLDTIAYDQRRMMIVLLPSNGRNNPIYLAPEVVQTRQATPTADIYAVAIVMIVLLTGMPPEELKTATDMWNWEERCNVSDRFIQILNIALSATRDFRYVNAGQMIRSLKPIIAIPEPKVDLNRLNPVGNSIAASSLQDEHSDPTVAEASQYLEPIDPNRLNTISSKKTPYIAFANGSNSSKSIGSTTNSTTNSTDIKANTSANSQFNSLDILGKSQGDVSQNDFCAFQLPFSSGDDSEDIQNDNLSQNEVSKTNKAGIAKATVYGGMESSKNGSLLSLGDKDESVESIPTSKFRILIALIFATGVIAGGLLSFLLLSRLSDPNKNLQFISSADLDKAIARVYESKKAEENIDKLLVLAKYKYEYSGNLSEAETMLQSIPSDLASRAKADQLLVQWQEDVKQNTAIIKDAEQALKNGNWQSAIDMVKSISPTPYWQDRGKAIAEDAKQRLAGTNTRTNTTNNTSANPSTNTPAVATVEAAREATRDNPPSTSDSQFYSPSSSENTSSGTSARTNTPPLSSPPVAEAPSPRVAPSSPPPPSPEPPVFSTPPATAAPPAPRIAN